MNEPLSTAGGMWHVAGWTMLHFLWLGCLAWGLAAVLRRGVERISPQVRSVCALACLGVQLALAVGVCVRITSHGGLLRSAVADPAVAIVASGSGPKAAALLQSIHGRDGLARTLGTSGSMSESQTDVASGVWQTAFPVLEVAARRLPWLWCLGTPAIALMFAAGVAGTFQLRFRSRPVVDRAILATLARLQSSLGVGQRVLLAVTDHAAAPLVLGIVRPLILLPPSVLSGLSPAQVEMILLHELAHVRRWDNLVNLLQRGVEALLFYHPAVWWASRWARLEREHCCDAVVLADGRDPQEYAETLASLALPELAPRYAAAALANHQLVSRIRHILNVEHRTMATSSRSLAVSAVILACVGGVGLWGLDALRPRAAAAQEETAAAPRDAGVEKAVGRALEFIGRQQAAGDTEAGAAPLSLDFAVPALGTANKDLFSFYVGFDRGQSEEQSRPWSPEQATGAPNVSEAGDSPNAWKPLTPDGGEEWLELTYAEPVQAAAVLVYESHNPGALSFVVAVREVEEPAQVAERIQIAARQDRTKRVSVFSLDVAFKINKVKLHLDTQRVAGWNEIDAVGLLDAATGEVHWAKSAQASSTYADRDSVRAGSLSEVAAKEYCQRCHAGVHDYGTVDQIISGWRDGRTTVCPECFQPNRDVREVSGALIKEYNARAAGSLADRRKLAEQLRQELTRLEAEIARQQAESAKQAEEEQRYADTLRGYYNQLADQARWASRTRDTDATQQPTLQDIAETLREQQQVIEKLTRALEALHLKLNGPASNSAPAAQDSGNTGDAPDPGSAAVTPQRDADLKYFEELLDQANASVDDATYLRRVMLDFAGVPPTAEQVRRFLENAAPDKRKQLLDELLNLASPETLKLLDAWQDELHPGVPE